MYKLKMLMELCIKACICDAKYAVTMLQNMKQNMEKARYNLRQAFRFICKMKYSTYRIYTNMSKKYAQKGKMCKINKQENMQNKYAK
jgi:hypothetical protein